MRRVQEFKGAPGSGALRVSDFAFTGRPSAQRPATRPRHATGRRARFPGAPPGYIHYIKQNDERVCVCAAGTTAGRRAAARRAAITRGARVVPRPRVDVSDRADRRRGGRRWQSARGPGTDLRPAETGVTWDGVLSSRERDV